MSAVKDKDKKQTEDMETAAEVDELKKRIEELEHNWKRALADYRNLEKRFAEEKEAIVKFSTSLLVSRMLSVLDNLEMMQAHIGDTGLKMIAKEFKQILMDEGLEEIDVMDKHFDATKMDASELVEGEKDKIVEVVQKGYTFKNKVIRPARVKVGKG